MGIRAFLAVASIKLSSFSNTKIGHMPAVPYTLDLLPFRLVGGEQEYIPKRPSCLL
jgi:hypothetical protein